MQRNGAAAAGSPALQDHFQTISVKFWPDAAARRRDECIAFALAAVTSWLLLRARYR